MTFSTRKGSETSPSENFHDEWFDGCPADFQFVTGSVTRKYDFLYTKEGLPFQGREVRLPNEGKQGFPL